MPKPLDEWDEEYVLALPTEGNSLERKGSRLLDLTEPGVKEGAVLDELAKQLSAFANTGGGHIIYGVDNKGDVDNGAVAVSVRGRQSTKDWLENIIPTLTDYEIVGCRVRPGVFEGYVWRGYGRLGDHTAVNAVIGLMYAGSKPPRPCRIW